MKNNTSLILVIIAFTLLAGMMRVDFVVYIGYVVAGIWLLGRLVTPRTLGQLKVGREFNPNAFLGEEVPVKIAVSNQSRLPVAWLQVREMTPHNLRSGTEVNEALELAAGESAELNYTVRAQRRGYYQVGPMELLTGDIFGFREDKGTFRSDFITIYPRILPIERLRLPSRLPFGTLPSKQRLYADPARPMGVRNFRSGDSLRQINWKVSGRYASAANGGLMVKTLEPAISLETLILLDLDREAFETRHYYQYSEWAIEVAASLAAHLVNQRQAIGLATNGYDPLEGGTLKFDDESGRLLDTTGNVVSDENAVIQPTNFIPPRTGRRHLMQVLELLARIESKRTKTWFADFASRATLNLSWGTTVLVVSPACDEKITGTLHRLLRSGYNPVLLCVQPMREFGRIRQRCKQLGFHAYHVLQETELTIREG